MKFDHLVLIFLLMLGIVGCETAMQCPVCPTCYTVNQVEFYLPAINQCVEDCAKYKEIENEAT